MNPWKRVPSTVIYVALVAAASLAAVPAAAQFYEDSRRLLDLSPDPLERSPRLNGMGRLSLVGKEHA